MSAAALLQPLCYEAGWGRPSVERPYPEEVHGVRWVVATDGHRLGALRSTEEVGPRATAAPPVATLIQDAIVARGNRVSIPALRDWVGPAPAPVPCDACKGTGRRPHFCACDLCFTQDEECDDCDSKTHTVKPPPSPGKIGKIVVNRDLLRDGLALFADGEARIVFQKFAKAASLALVQDGAVFVLAAMTGRGHGPAFKVAGVTP